MKPLTIIIMISFLILLLRLWYLQIVKGESFRYLSDNNRIRMISLSDYRGKILDRNKKTIVSIRPSFDLYIIPEDIKDMEEVFSLLYPRLGLDKDELERKIKSSPPFKHILIKGDISREDVAFIMEHNLDLTGVLLKIEPMRSYEYNDLASHIIGYLGEITREQLKKRGNTGYDLGDFVGQYSLEEIYEDLLRGEKGGRGIEVDASGRELRVIGEVKPKAGHNLILTIDLGIQMIADRLMEGKVGSIVVMDPNNGEVLAMVSRPSFDPNLFARGVSESNWSALIKDPRHPIQNRAIEGQYPPGSIYKIVTAIAGLEEGVITRDTTFNCPGFYNLGRGIYRCWKKGGHGSMDVYQALVQSCDVFFYNIGYRVGIDALKRYALDFGLGRPTSIDLEHEKGGLIPSTEWKKNVRGEPWFIGETISASIGQGYNMVTPIQMANMIAVIANGGTLWRPYILKRIEDINGMIIKEVNPDIIKEIHITPKTLNIIRKALLDVVADKNGTGKLAYIEGIDVAGKTGTAQVVRFKRERDEEKKEIPFEFRDHGWFISFAPFDKPQIAIAVLVEHGGESGGRSAAPIAKEIIKEYFRLYPIPKPD
ncbi:MAG: penicillin-binding protein 2 [Nitrospinae bacterium]|nr:penicillin-binding protein 2 [Nitrospinota bacterium]